MAKKLLSLPLGKFSGTRRALLSLFLGAWWEGAGFLRPQPPGLTILLPGLPLCFRHQAWGPLWGREAGLLQRLSPLEWLPREGLKQKQVHLGLLRLLCHQIPRHRAPAIIDQ